MEEKLANNSYAPYISLVIPAYNEGRRIYDSLLTIQEYIDQQPYDAEILLVDDGSTDDTVAVAKAALKGYHGFRVLSYNGNMGKGFALQKGMLSSKGKFIFFMDADLSTPINEMEPFLRQLEQGSDIVIGTRKTDDAIVEKRQPYIRETLGRVFTLITNMLLVNNISDITCGFKGFNKKVVYNLFGRQLIYNWSFDAEILFLAQKLQYKIQELPVTWYDSEGSKVRLSRDVIGSLKGIFEIRLNHLFGRYDMKRGYSYDQE